MKQIKLIAFLLIIGIISFSSCESVEESQKTADKFFEAYNNVNEKVMANLLDKESVIEAGVKQDFYNVFSQHQNNCGKVKNYERYAFNTNINNGQTIVTLKFKCETEKVPEVYEKLKFIKRDNEYKIIEYQYNIDKYVIDNEE